MSFKDDLNKNKVRSTKAMTKQAEVLTKKIPSEYLTPKDREVLNHYTGNLYAAVRATFKTLQRNLVSVKCGELMRNPHFNKSIQLMDNSYEKYGLLSALELRKTLEKMIKSKLTTDSNKITAIKLLMTDKGMIGAKSEPTNQTNNTQIVINNPVDNVTAFKALAKTYGDDIAGRVLRASVAQQVPVCEVDATLFLESANEDQ